MEAKNNNKVQGSVIAVGIIGLVLGFFIGWFIGKGNYVPPTDLSAVTDQEESSDSSTTEEESGDVRNSLQENQEVVASTLNVNTKDAAFTVADQKAGDSVMVKGVSVTKTTWVAVRENNSGKLGNILGARRIESGNNQNVEVMLLRPTEAGKEYFAVLFEDNGDKTFSNKTDVMVVKDGDVLGAGFKAN